MIDLLLIAAGGAIGALLRYWCSSRIYDLFGDTFPYGTLTINVIGSFMIGVIFVFIVERGQLSEEWRAFLVIGLLGAFTTFSSFSLETITLFEIGQINKALSNIVISVFLCLGSCWLAIIMARQVRF